MTKDICLGEMSCHSACFYYVMLSPAFELQVHNPSISLKSSVTTLLELQKLKEKVQ